MGPAKDAKGGERREVRGETATPRRVSARCWMTVTGTWNLSIYCNSSGMPSITHVTSRDSTLDAVGTRSCVIRRMSQFGALQAQSAQSLEGQQSKSAEPQTKLVTRHPVGAGAIGVQI